MTRKNMWVAGLAMPVVIAMLLLFAGSTERRRERPALSGKRGGENR